MNAKPKLIPSEDKRVFFFEYVEAGHGQQETMEYLRGKAEFSLLVSRLEKDLDMKEFVRLCSNIGKPKEFIKLARYTELMPG